MAFPQRLVILGLVALFFIVLGHNYGEFSIAEFPETSLRNFQMLETTGIPPFSAHSVRIYIGVVCTLLPSLCAFSLNVR
jgi:hypothetical protein